MWEKELVNVIQEAYMHGVSTRKVDALVQALGLDGIDKSTVSRISKELDYYVQSFLKSRLDRKYPYLWLDTTFPKVREGGHVNNMAFIIAVGVNEEGEHEILGVDIDMTESGPFPQNQGWKRIPSIFFWSCFRNSIPPPGATKPLWRSFTGPGWTTKIISRSDSIYGVAVNTMNSGMTAPMTRLCAISWPCSG